MPASLEGGVATSVATLALVALYITLRALAWQSQLPGSLLLESPDSVGYLNQIRAFQTFDLSIIKTLEPEMTPFYVGVAALVGLFPVSVETAARTTSFVASIIFFISFLGVGTLMLGRLPALVAGFLVAINPTLIRYSYSVLTEPTYVALIFAGLWLFLSQRSAPSVLRACVLGFVLGLAFLTRVEGILYLIFIPASLLLYWKSSFGWRKGIAWMISFLIAFSVIAAPQVYYVSKKLGSFSINGRTIWSQLIHRPTGNFYSNIYGLDFSSSETNLLFMYHTPDAVQERISLKDSLRSHGEDFARNLALLNFGRLGEVLGVGTLIFFGIGLFTIFSNRNPRDGLWTLMFLLFGVVAPLSHMLVTRHILVIVPMIFLIAAFGIVQAASNLLVHFWRREYVLIGVLFFMVLLSMPSTYPIVKLYAYGDFAGSFGADDFPRPTSSQPTVPYVPDSLAEVARIIEGSAGRGETPLVVTLEFFLGEQGDLEIVPLPYTDLQGLKTYMTLNDAAFLLLRGEAWPFEAEFAGAAPEGFEELYEAEDSRGVRMRLFRFRPEAGVISGE